MRNAGNRQVERASVPATRSMCQHDTSEQASREGNSNGKWGELEIRQIIQQIFVRRSEDTKEALAEDKKFLADLGKNCELKKKEWAEYKRMQGIEEVALADTIKVRVSGPTS